MTKHVEITHKLLVLCTVQHGALLLLKQEKTFLCFLQGIFAKSKDMIHSSK